MMITLANDLQVRRALQQQTGRKRSGTSALKRETLATSPFGYEAGRRHSRNSPNGTAPDNN